MPDPQKLLTRLEVAIESGALPRDVGVWLQAGLDSYRRGGSISVALGLRGRGVRSYNNSNRIRRRNHWLSEAAAFVSVDPISAWERAGRLSKAIIRFQHQVWPRVKNNPPPPFDDPGADPLTHYIHLAFFAHPSDESTFPSSQRQIYRLLN